MSVQQPISNLEVSAEQLRERCTKKDSQGISSEIIQLVEEQFLLPNTRLPTVRSFATSMNVNVNTIAAAWSHLRDAGYIETRRRGGSFVVEGTKAVWAPNGGSQSINLSHSSGDPTLRPDLSDALSFGLSLPGLHAADLEYIIDPLKTCAVQQWPFEAEGWMIAGASSESILLAVSAICSPGMKIAVEQPTSSRLLKILALIEVEAVGVNWDEQGPGLKALEAALETGVAAFIYQPRSHLPLGLTVTPSRAESLAKILARHPDIAIIEDDPLGPLSAATPASIGYWLPQQTLLVRSFCKAFGLDLRTSIMGGSAKHIAAIRKKRSSGIGMISRILQGALYYLLTDIDSLEKTEAVRNLYAARRHILERVLTQQGVTFKPYQTGLLLWLSVDSEARVIGSLAAKNILVSEGSRYFIKPSTPHIAINIATLPSDESQITAIGMQISTTLLNLEQTSFD